MSTATIEQTYNNIKENANARLDALSEKPVVYVGTATCGLAAGAEEVKTAFVREIEKNNLDAEVRDAGCMGFCFVEPIVVVDKPGFSPMAYSEVDEGLAERLVQDFLMEDDPCYEFAMAAMEPDEIFPTLKEFPRGVIEEKILLKDCGNIDPYDIDEYIKGDGYHALAVALDQDPLAIVEEIKKANLRGRGGAGFPAGLKWSIFVMLIRPVIKRC